MPIEPLTVKLTTPEGWVYQGKDDEEVWQQYQRDLSRGRQLSLKITKAIQETGGHIEAL